MEAILLEVYDGRHAYYPSELLPVSFDLLGTILPLAASLGLEVHAWMWCMPCMVDEIMKLHPDWYNVNARGESALDRPAYVAYYKFLDPGRPEVREWVRKIVLELAQIAELAGIHLDYIRHPDAVLPSALRQKYGLVQDRVYPQFDYGYSDYERGEFKREYGIDPLNILDPESHREWMQYRFDMVTGMVNEYLVPAAHSRGKSITAAVFPGPAMARKMVRQDWGRWNLDAFLPMLYQDFYSEGSEWVRRRTEEAVLAVRKPVYSGLYVHGISAPALRETMKMAMRGGASGVSLFTTDDMNSQRWSMLREVAKRD